MDDCRDLPSANGQGNADPMTFEGNTRLKQPLPIYNKTEMSPPQPLGGYHTIDSGSERTAEPNEPHGDLL